MVFRTTLPSGGTKGRRENVAGAEIRKGPSSPETQLRLHMRTERAKRSFMKRGVYLSLSSRLATVFETAGRPILRSRAAAENEPDSTTLMNISISRRRSIPEWNKSYHWQLPSVFCKECLH
jgi:hypothetical protein